MNLINLTPHDIALNTGPVLIFRKSGKVARVSVEFSKVKELLYLQHYGEIENLPEPQPDVKYIVSAIVFNATNRLDVVAPATGHPDTVRNEAGHIISVPGFIVKL